eukprot:INCI4445.1.p1 GENE.INCI4445.1~~INCI4445.1.p1  ORF type:complete len:428 (-),score=77.66 INCI4445.1:106-1389(-)
MSERADSASGEASEQVDAEASDGDGDKSDDTEEEALDPDEEAAHQSYVKQLQLFVRQLLASGQLDAVVDILKRSFSYYGEREYVTPQTDLHSFAEKFVAADNDIEYCFALSFDVTFFARLCYEGFLSICSFPADFVYLLMPWIAPTRAVMNFGGMHVSRQLRKRARSYYMTVNTDLEGVMKGCVQQHGEAWLYEPMRDLLRKAWCDTSKLHEKYDAADGPQAARWRLALRNSGFRVVTFEMWDSSTGRLVAGDLGYVVGSCYTSMTGFRDEGTRSCGTIQLVCTYSLLKRCGFSFWDLGMVMDYKKALGARVVTRKEFMKMFHPVRDRMCTLSIAHDEAASGASGESGGGGAGKTASKKHTLTTIMMHQTAGSSTVCPAVPAVELVAEAFRMQKLNPSKSSLKSAATKEVAPVALAGADAGGKSLNP